MRSVRRSLEVVVKCVYAHVSISKCADAVSVLSIACEGERTHSSFRDPDTFSQTELYNSTRERRSVHRNLPSERNSWRSSTVHGATSNLSKLKPAHHDTLPLHSAQVTSSEHGAVSTTSIKATDAVSTQRRQERMARAWRSVGWAVARIATSVIEREGSGSTHTALLSSTTVGANKCSCKSLFGRRSRLAATLPPHRRETHVLTTSQSQLLQDLQGPPAPLRVRSSVRTTARRPLSESVLRLRLWNPP